MQRLKVTCKKCKNEEYVIVQPPMQCQFESGAQTKLLSARYRRDRHWGFQCMCGADSRLCKEEIPDIDTLVDAPKMTIKNLKNRLAKVKSEPFILQEV